MKKFRDTMKIRNYFPILLLFISCLVSVFASGTAYYVTKDGCFIISELCDGSFEKPFGDLITAFTFIEKNNKPELQEIIVYITDTASSCESYTVESNFNFFVDWPSLNISVRGVKAEKSILKYCDGTAISLLARGGKLKLENISFIGVLDSSSMNISPTSSDLSGFIILQLESKLLLSLVNCEFIGTFSSATSRALFPSLISFGKKVNQLFLAGIYFEKVTFKDCRYSLGIINLKSPLNISKSCIIEVVNSELINYNTEKDFTHWFGGFRMKNNDDEYFDFAFILNNTQLIMRNFSVFNASRVILANKNNDLLITNFTISLPNDVTRESKNPPEFIYLIMFNNIKLTGLSVTDSTIYSFDDTVEPTKRDLAFLNASFVPTTLLNFEKNQALFAFGAYNTGELKEIVFMNTTIFKRENFGLSIFGVEYKNKILIQSFLMNLTILDSQSRFGFLAVLYLAATNDVTMTIGTILDLNIYGYSNILFCFYNSGNKFKASNLVFQRTYLKTKSNRAEVMAFMYSFRNSPGVVFFSKSEDIKTGGIFFGLVGNTVELQEIDADDVICLIGCLITLFYKNSLKINKSVLKFGTSEVIASSLSIAFGNTLRAKFLILEKCQGSTGAVYLYRANDAIFENSEFNSNLGTGGFPYFKFLEVSGNFALVYENKMVLIASSIILGKSYTLGGAFMLASQNFVQILDSIIMSNEAQNGGAILSKLLNIVTINNTQFIDNYGTMGGTLFGEESNTIIFKNCSFEMNQAEVSSVIFLNLSNIFTIERASFTKNQGFVQGGLIILYGMYQKVNLTDIEFFNNQAPFKGFLIELNEKNLLALTNCVIDYGETGNGNFLYLNTTNNLTAKNLLIKNINNMNVFIKCSEENILTFSQTVIENNQWLDSFFHSENFNIIVINETSITNVIILSGSSGFVRADYKSTVYLKNISFNTLTSRGNIILEAEKGNKLFVWDMTLINIKLIEAGVGLNLVDSNQLNVSGILFHDFYGYSNNIFLMQIFKENSLTIFKMNVTGYSSMEQVWNSTCMIKIIGNNNSILFNEAWTLSENPDFFKVETLVYLRDQGIFNFVSFLKSKITLSNYHSFLEVEAEGTIVIEDTRFTNSKIYGDLIILKNRSELSCIGTDFFSNFLNDNKTLIRVSEMIKAELIKVHENTNNLFMISINSTIKVSKSTFLLKNNKIFPGKSTHLFIIEQESTITFYCIYVLLRENTLESIICASSSNLEVRLSLFAFNQGLYGGIFKIANQSSLFLFQNKFIGNEGLYGGVLNFDNISRVDVEKNYFLTNKALNKKSINNTVAKGGCIFASMEENQGEPYFQIKDNKFINNGGEIGGIIYLKGKKSPQFFSANLDFFNGSNYFEKTKVRYYGTYMASPPIDMKIISGSDLSNEPLDSIVIKEKIPFNISLENCLLQVISIDYFGQQTLGETDFSNIIITESEGYTINLPLYNTFPCFKSINPGSSTSLNLLAQSEISFNISANLLTRSRIYDKEQTLQIKLNISKCQRGQFFDLKNLQCVECQPNFFSFEYDYIEPSSCRSCLSEPFNCYGGFNLTPKAGYWRRSQETTNFMQCPYPPACLGDLVLAHEDNQLTILNEDYDYAYTLGMCAIGHTGILCSKCQVGYGKISGERCSLCKGGLNIFLMVLKIMVRIFLYFYTIYKAVMLCKKVKNNLLQKDLVYSNFLLKILYLHFQFLRTFLGFPLYFPSVIKEIFNIFTFSLSSGADKVINLECFFVFDTIPALYLYTLINIIAPLIVVSIVGLILKKKTILIKDKRPTLNLGRKMKLYLAKFIKKISKKSLNLLPYLFLVAIMLTYDETLNLLIHNFSTINILDINSPENRLVNHLEIDFDSKQHRRWLYYFASPATFFLAFFLPGFIFISIYRAKKKGTLYSKETQLRFGYFFFAYNDKNEYYETIYILRKVFLIAMDSFFIKALSITKRYDATTFSVLICFFYFGLTIITFRNSPYKQNMYPVLNKMEKFSVSIQALTSWIGCFLLSLDSDSSTFSLMLMNYLGFFVGVVINVILFLFWASYFWKLSMRKRLKSYISIIRLKMTRKKSTVKIDSPLSENKITDDGNCYTNTEENLFVNSEEKEIIIFPPKFLNEWNDRSNTTPSPDSGSNKEATPFYIINEHFETSNVGKRISSLWDYFEYFDKNNLKNQIRTDSKCFQTFEIISFLKETIEARNSSSLMRINILLKYDMPCAEDILLDTLTQKAQKRNAFKLLISKYENDASQRQVNIGFILSIVDIKQVRFANKFKFTLYESMSEKKLLTIELDVFFFEFLFKLDKNESLISQTYQDLLKIGKRYSSDSQILNLCFPSENIIFQIIQPYKFKGNQFLEFYYLRLITMEKQIESSFGLRSFLENLMKS